jgi:hypothetical protein
MRHFFGSRIGEAHGWRNSLGVIVLVIGVHNALLEILKSRIMHLT